MMDHHQSPATRQLDADNLELHNLETINKPGIKSNEKPRSVAASEYEEAESAFPKAKERHLRMRVWTWEIICLVLALGIIGAFTYVLSGNDNKRLPEFPLDISLNAIVAIVAAVLRSLVMLVVTEALGQARWSWFLQRNRSAPHPLQDLETFARGPYSITGAFRLFVAVFRRGWRRGVTSSAGGLALMAAFLTLISFGTGPALQQAINTKECLVQNKELESTIPVAQHATGAYGTLPSVLTTNYILELNPELKATMYNGLTNPLGRDSAVVPICPTGNCTFQTLDGWTHSSIGICTTCIDTSSFVEKLSSANATIESFTLLDEERQINVSSRSGNRLLAIAPGDSSRFADFARSTWSPTFEEVAQNSVLNFSLLTFSDAPCSKMADGTLQCPREVVNAYWNRDRNTSYIAASCRLYPCLRHYHANVDKGIMVETLNSTVPARVEQIADTVLNSFAENFTAMRVPCRLPDQDTIYTAQNLSSVPRTSDRVFYNVSVQHPDTPSEFHRAEVPAECTYSISYRYAHSIGEHARTIFNGACSSTGRMASNSNMTDCSPAWWLAPLYKNRNASFESVSRALDLFADAVTNKLRVDGPERSIELGDEAKEILRAAGDVEGFVRGQVWETTVCTVPSWRWLSFPAVLVVLTVGLLVGVVAVAWREPDLPVWKASVLPLIFYGLRDGRGEGYEYSGGEVTRRSQDEPRDHLMNLGHMKKTAEKILVGFHPGDGPGFMVDDDSSALVRRRKPYARHSDMDVDSLLQQDDDLPDPQHTNAQGYDYGGDAGHARDKGGGYHNNIEVQIPLAKPEDPATAYATRSWPIWSEADRFDSPASPIFAQSPVEVTMPLGTAPSPHARTLTVSAVSTESLAHPQSQTSSEHPWTNLASDRGYPSPIGRHY
ncbi:hypothetical protein PspLS_07047 [Pyricularia sp. CBS 133598]|nr:hypothetical protein PspLS_07047 [Pyricularia sp. CBS 133598]